MQLVFDFVKTACIVAGLNVTERFEYRSIFLMVGQQSFRMSCQLQEQQSHGHLTHFAPVWSFLYQCPQQIFYQILNGFYIGNIKMQIACAGILTAEAVHQKSSQRCFLLADGTEAGGKEIRQHNKVYCHIRFLCLVNFVGGALTQKQQISLFQNDPFAAHNMGRLPGAHIHHFHIVVGMLWKMDKAGMGPQSNQLTGSQKLLGVDELHFYDVYTPLLADVDKKIPHAEAKQTVYDALAPLGDNYRKILKDGFENRWIDVYQNEGKRSGAYSAGAAVHPYVLLNYTGTLDSQFTLAHEMGHALHSWYSNKNQNPIDADYVIFVAEVASTCNEALLMEYLLGKTTDKTERAYLINQFLEQFKGTLYRQTMFAEFELNIGKMIGEGKTLTAEALSAEYKRLNELYFGPDMVVDDLIALEWARIPHFYYNYYVFQYATGYSAAIALSRKILREGESAVNDYIRFLSGGCSKSPIDLLKDAGVDMTSPEPVEQALQLFGELLDEMEALMAE